MIDQDRAQPGSPGAAAAAQAAAALALAEQLSELGTGLDAAAELFPRGSSSWAGLAAHSLELLLAARPQEFRQVASACRQAAGALALHGETAAAVATLERRQARPELALAIEGRSAAVIEASARQAAGTIGALAGAAPARGSRLSRLVGRVAALGSEVEVGAIESSEVLASLVLHAAAVLANPADPRTLQEVRAAGTGLAQAARHPGEVAKAMADWDTWRANPARAVGHLLPDLIAALASGGVAAGTRGATLARAGRAAIASVGQRRAALAAGAGAARAALHGEALAAVAEPGAAAWAGEGGATLTAADAAQVRAFHRLNAAAEERVTAGLRRASAVPDAELAGLDQRLKGLDSFNRKLATVRATTGRPLPLILTQVHDALRYTVVIQDRSYVRGVLEISRQLEAQGFHFTPPRNAWLEGDGYQGINSRWIDPHSGAAFEVQFHTPASWQVTKATHLLYEQKRQLATSPQRRTELEALLAQAYAQVPVPAGLATITAKTFPPLGVPSRSELPIDYTVHVALGTGVGLRAAGAPPAAEPGQQVPGPAVPDPAVRGRVGR